MHMKIKKGDQVKILTGKDRNKTGKVIKVMPASGKILAEGLNLHKKHVKSRQAEKKGEIVLLPGPINLSKVQLVCPHCGKPTRVGYDLSGSTKVRICKKCRQSI